MKIKRNFIMLLIALLVIIAVFLGFDTGKNLDYVIPRRLIRLASILIVAISVAYSSILFQTITNNKILTPAIMGYESIFILLQTLVVFFYGDKTFEVVSQMDNFVYAVVVMMGFSLMMYFLIFAKGKRNIYLLLLMGLVLGTLFQTLAQFVQIILDPNEFSMVESYLFVSFNKMNSDLLLIGSLTLLITLIIGQRYLKYLDVIALGRDQAINLGLNYNKLIKIYMVLISVLVSVSTALVGPVTFLGILVTNLTYEIFPSNRHKQLVWFCSLIACFTLLLGQVFVEHIFSFSTTVSIVINFVGGIYFLFLILKSRKSL